ncbi:uncharacterized protein K452DRAFT_270884 [Aplosporella prunicola CBS 121167]|uniref:UBX domain-containing protein n=1 Tax=Aplosporella prunicola CBS 121167 TaxID=1176127 RepID=A0A6A6BEY3_9PEZI|nr:uncharacterized protein K452DRAFT_270884 [Aplosporella prunicola CBS 121167]KAF2142128.1 hypothetical protein K452DRAFT_270884 [Aplosporella prunicola CBS 121167]
MDDNIANFAAITGSDPQRAGHYLQLTDNNLEQAIQLFFDSPNLDFGGSTAEAAPSQPAARQDDQGVIHIDSDDEENVSGAAGHDMDADEAMARRLQEEMYRDSGSDPNEGVRAPMARTTETLVGPGADYGDEDDGMHAAIMSQMAARRRGGQGARPGIFNQRNTASVWEGEDDDQSARRRHLATATGGASETSSKSSLLAEMYRPPFEIISSLPWDGARDEGKAEEKWIMVNVQDPAIFDCQVLNRDIWKNDQVKETIKENFIFLQYNKDDPSGNSYINYYFHARDSDDAYPHIAIVDPRTGEQVKVWSGPPVPKAMDFVMQLHEFLDRYSLKVNVRNPVATRKKDKKKDVNKMTEEEMLEMALQNSIANDAQGPRDEDPDELTKAAEASGKGKEKASDEGAMEVDEPATTGDATATGPFASISSTNPHTEPDNDPKTTTRIQFRHSGGRIIRRFALADPVRRIYEWLKASPLEGKEGVEFELSFMGKNLIDLLDQSIEQAGLKNGTVMVEHIEG